MKVKRLKMQSFRGIGDLTLDFDETKPTVLIGINGVGKSSILDCLAILLSQLTANIQNLPSAIRSFDEQDISNNCKETHNRITIFLDSVTEANWSMSKVSKKNYEQNERMSPQNVQVKLKSQIDDLEFLKREYLSSNHKNYLIAKINDLQALYESIIQSQEEVIKALESLSKQLEREGVLEKSLQTAIDYIFSQLKTNSEASIPLAVYYPVNRAVIDMPLEISEKNVFKQIDAYEQALTGGRIDFKSFFEWFRNREDLENEKRRDNPDYRDKQLETVRQAISSLIPDFSNLRVERFPLRMTVKKSQEELIVNQLSDGEKCLLAMVGDLARRLAIANPGLSEPLQGAGVVLIDEIELHLHPKWQREIIPALTRTFPNCQFIVTTHSPQVISHVKPEGIYILEKTDNGVIAKRPESSFGRDSNRILEDLMDVPERPQEIKTSLLELFRLIDAGNLEGARKLRQQLATEIGSDEPEFVRADVLIRRKEILNR